MKEAARLGMHVFLMTSDLINRDGSDVSGLPQGGLDELLEKMKNAEKC